MNLTPEERAELRKRCQSPLQSPASWREVRALLDEIAATTRALALVETSLRDAKSAEIVRRKTGGNAPESVQGILDGVTRLYDQIDAQAARIAELEADNEAMVKQRAALLKWLNEADTIKAAWEARKL